RGEPHGLLVVARVPPAPSEALGHRTAPHTGRAGRRAVRLRIPPVPLGGAHVERADCRAVEGERFGHGPTRAPAALATPHAAAGGPPRPLPGCVAIACSG